jgi:hypothetical protein
VKENLEQKKKAQEKENMNENEGERPNETKREDSSKKIQEKERWKVKIWIDEEAEKKTVNGKGKEKMKNKWTTRGAERNQKNVAG